MALAVFRWVFGKFWKNLRGGRGVKIFLDFQLFWKKSWKSTKFWPSLPSEFFSFFFKNSLKNIQSHEKLKSVEKILKYRKLQKKKNIDFLKIWIFNFFEKNPPGVYHTPCKKLFSIFQKTPRLGIWKLLPHSKPKSCYANLIFFRQRVW